MTTPSSDGEFRNCERANPKPEDKKRRPSNADVAEDSEGFDASPDEIDDNDEDEKEEEEEEEEERMPPGRKTKTRSGLVSILKLKGNECKRGKKRE